MPRGWGRGATKERGWDGASAKASGANRVGYMKNG